MWSCKSVIESHMKFETYEVSIVCVGRTIYVEGERGREGGGRGRERERRESTPAVSLAFPIYWAPSEHTPYRCSSSWLPTVRADTINRHTYGKYSTMEPIELWRVKLFVNVWKLTLNWHVNCYSSLPWLHQMLLFRWFQGFQNRWWSVAAFLLSLLHLWLYVWVCVCDL